MSINVHQVGFDESDSGKTSDHSWIRGRDDVGRRTCDQVRSEIHRGEYLCAYVHTALREADATEASNIQSVSSIFSYWLYGRTVVLDNVAGLNGHIVWIDYHSCIVTEDNHSNQVR